MGSENHGLRLEMDHTPRKSVSTSQQVKEVHPERDNPLNTPAIQTDHKQALQRSFSRVSNTLTDPPRNPHTQQHQQIHIQQQLRANPVKTQVVKFNQSPQELNKDIRDAAIRAAKENFDPARSLMLTQKQVNSFISTHPALKNNAQLAERVVNDLQLNYEKAYEAEFMNMNWFKRQYYMAQRVVGATFGAVGKAVSYVSGGEIFKDLAALKDRAVGLFQHTVELIDRYAPGTKFVVDKIAQLGGNLYKIAATVCTSTYEIITNPNKGIPNAWARFERMCTRIKNTDWQALGKDCVEFVKNVANGIIYLNTMPFRAAVYVYNNPQKVWNNCVNAAKVAWGVAADLASNIATKVVEGFNAFIKDPIGAIKYAGGRVLAFGKEICDSLGITDIVAGIYHLGLAGIELSKGNPFAATRHAKESLRAVKGGLMALGEFTGVSDLGRAVYHLSRGEFVQAGMYAVCGAVQITGLLTTAGMANLLSTPAKKMALKGMTLAAESVTKEVIQAIQKKITTETLGKVAKDIVLDGTKQILKTAKKDLSPELVENIFKKTSSEMIEKTMRDHGIDKIITSHTSELLSKIYNSKRSDLAKEFVEQGVSKKEAKQMAKYLQKALGKPGYYNRQHAMLEGALIEEFTQAIKKDFMERGLSESFDRVWEKALVSIQRYHKLSDEMIMEMRIAGRKGFEEGIESGIRKVVREAVEEAFSKYRKFRPNLDRDNIDKAMDIDLYTSEHIVDRVTLSEAKRVNKVSKVKGYKKGPQDFSISRNLETGEEIKNSAKESKFSEA